MLKSFFRAAVVPIRNYAIKSDLKIKWIGPEFIHNGDPRKSGDLLPALHSPKETIGLWYKDIPAVSQLDENVKKLLTVQFLGPRHDAMLMRKEMRDRIKRHDYDFASIESKIATITGQIRYLQDTLKDDKSRKNHKMKCYLAELVDKRKKYFRFLRKRDYKLYEWLLEKLDLEFKAHPHKRHWITRKESLKRLTILHCDGLREEKLEQYKKLLESQQGPFLKKKLDAYKLIRSEQEALGLQVTINTKHIQEVEDLLLQWEERQKKALTETKPEKPVCYLVDIIDTRVLIKQQKEEEKKKKKAERKF